MSLRPIIISGLLAAATAFSPTTTVGTNVASYARSSRQSSSSSSSSSVLSMVAVDTSEIKNGLTIEIDGDPYKIMGFSIMKQARGAAKTTIKMKNLKRGNTIENTYRSGEKFETAEIIRKPSQYTYEDEAGNYMFMDIESFEEVMVEQKMIEEQKKWISEGMQCDLIYFKGDVIEVRAPSPYVFEVVETEPNVKGNTSQGYTKPAVLSCGATISVPGFVEQGQMVKVDTEKGEYMERV